MLGVQIGIYSLIRIYCLFINILLRTACRDDLTDKKFTHRHVYDTNCMMQSLLHINETRNFKPSRPTFGTNMCHEYVFIYMTNP